ncbi:MAG TPA: hypothetical protein VGE81_06710 [Candidatus Limnocylindrales bacterium]
MSDHALLVITPANLNSLDDLLGPSASEAGRELLNLVPEASGQRATIQLIGDVWNAGRLPLRGGTVLSCSGQTATEAMRNLAAAIRSEAGSR